MPKITKSKRGQAGRVEVQAKTRTDQATKIMPYRWWKAKSKGDLAEQIVATTAFLKQQQQYRYRQIGIYARMYGNMPLNNFVGSNFNKMNTNSQLPIDRPTMNVVQSCVDTLVSKITQSRPRPVFLTDNGDYKERNIAKQLNTFAGGELYQTKAYDLAPLVIRDACVTGTGCIKLYEHDNKVCLERVLQTELFVDPNEAHYANPRQLFQLKLVDRDVLKEMFPGNDSMIDRADQAFIDNSSESSQTVSDQVMIVEAWHLPSGKKAKDGRHAIAVSSGTLFDNSDYDKESFPFVFMHYSPRLTGFWGQGLAEQLMGTQIEINKILSTISVSMNLVGVPRIFVEDGSKVVSAHLNNAIGSIIKYRGTKPEYSVAPCVPAELYDQLQRLVGYAYQQSGVSSLSATSQKPQGLNSGEALREYNDIQTDRFASINKRYDNVFIDLVYGMTDMAIDIAEREGSYQTIYPNKNGAKEIDLPNIKLLQDPFVIQCFDVSSLPKDPAGRLQKITEMTQSGMITLQEGRRLLDYPDLEQIEKLANASEERILQILDDIVEHGKWTPPDPFMNLQLAQQYVVQYYNLYSGAKLEESRCQMLRDFFSQIQMLNQAAQPPPQMAPGGPQAVPQARPVSDVLPNSPQAA